MGRAIPPIHTIPWSDVRSILIIYSNYCLWMLTHVISSCIISSCFSSCFSSVVSVFPGTSTATNQVTSCFTIFSRYVILANLLQCMCPHLFVFLSFLSCFWVFLGISWYVFHAKQVTSTDVNFGLVIALYNNYFWTCKNFVNTISKYSWIPYYIKKKLDNSMNYHDLG